MRHRQQSRLKSRRQSLASDLRCSTGRRDKQNPPATLRARFGHARDHAITLS
jgi:hypothetical protein